MKQETKSGILFIVIVLAMVLTSLAIIYVAFFLAGSHVALTAAPTQVTVPV